MTLSTNEVAKVQEAVKRRVAFAMAGSAALMALAAHAQDGWVGLGKSGTTSYELEAVSARRVSAEVVQYWIRSSDPATIRMIAGKRVGYLQHLIRGHCAEGWYEYLVNEIRDETGAVLFRQQPEDGKRIFLPVTGPITEANAAICRLV